MDSIRTLLLARTHTVILDADSVANASTRPARHGDIERFEAELAELGYVMSLDLGMLIRRLPHQAIDELRGWILRTLTRAAGAHRPAVPLFSGFPSGTPAETYSLYARRVLSWLATRPEQPCPWCARIQPVRALDPCGHLVCRSCWSEGSFSGCPLCHRRVSPTEPFVVLPPGGPRGERVGHPTGELRVLHLAFDVVGVARDRFERLIARPAPLNKEDRVELEAVIDAMGPKAAAWLPPRIPVRETMAIAVARLWMVSPDRAVMMRKTQGHLRTATDVLRVAAVLMHADPALTEPLRFRSIGRRLRRAVLEVLDRLPTDQVVEDMRRHPGLWKRAGERLHPFELAAQLPGAALAFAALRRTDLDAATFGPALRARAAELPNVRISDGRVRVLPWAGAVEDALRAGDPRAAAARLATRPGELLRRADQLARVTSARQPDALADVLASIQSSLRYGAPASLLALAAHISRRGALWPRRVFFPHGDVLRPWLAPDGRPPLPPAAIAAIADGARAELVARAESRPRFARAVIDRGLADLLVPLRARSAPGPKLAWPRGSELVLPDAASIRLFLHWEEPAGARVDLDLAVALFDHDWRHVATCDAKHPSVSTTADAPAAVHSGNVTSAPPPLGATELVELHAAPLAAAGIRHAMVLVRGRHAASFERLPLGFVGLSPGAAHPAASLDPRAAWPRFDLRGSAALLVPLAIDLASHRLRWIDVHIRGRGTLHRAGGSRTALAHLGRDFAHLLASGAHPTLWELASIHATARANVVYVRGPSGITTYRRRDNEPSTGRLARLLAGDHDGTVPAIPTANAPTWVALLRDDLPIPTGSAGYILDARRTTGESLTRALASDLIAELAPRG